MTQRERALGTGSGSGFPARRHLPFKRAPDSRPDTGIHFLLMKSAAPLRKHSLMSSSPAGGEMRIQGTPGVTSLATSMAVRGSIFGMLMSAMTRSGWDSCTSRRNCSLVRHVSWSTQCSPSSVAAQKAPHLSECVEYDDLGFVAHGIVLRTCCGNQLFMLAILPTPALMWSTSYAGEPACSSFPPSRLSARFSRRAKMKPATPSIENISMLAV